MYLGIICILNIHYILHLLASKHFIKKKIIVNPLIRILTPNKVKAIILSFADLIMFLIIIIIFF